MSTKKTLVEDWIEYLRPKGLMSARLMNILKGNYATYDKYNQGCFVEDIHDVDLLRCRHAGKKTIAEYRILKERYLRHAPKREILYVAEDEEDENVNRKKYDCLLRYDVIKALNTIYHERYYVEEAILEKFERDGIQLPKYPPTL